MADTDTSLPPEAVARIADLAARARRANGPLMRAINGLGGQAEAWAARLPAPARRAADAGAEELLMRLYRGAAGAGKVLPAAGRHGHRIAAAVSGAAGGAAGIASAVVELPATVMVMFAAMQRIAAENGFDPDSPEVRLTCIDIFGSGGPGREDDGIDTSFLGARLSMNGTTIRALVARVAPAFSAMLGKSLASKAVPVIGAAAGAGINYAFTGYYEEIARVRFGLQRLVVEHGEAPVVAAYEAARRRAP
ncbi:MAG: EcsC family protein [Proteobacteria bacterium]|nr:EcsC family protein [Pseudomonadota bacterium]